MYELPEMVVAETADHTEEDKDINPGAAFLPLPPPPDADDETIIQPKIKRVVVEDVLEGDEEPDEDATNDNENDNNAITDDGEMEIGDDEIFHPNDPSPSEKRTLTSPCMKLRKRRWLSYSHLHKFEDEFTNVTYYALTQYTLKAGM